MQRHLSSVLLLILCSVIAQCQARSSRYYDMINDVNAGHNYYAILGVDVDASPSELRKAFRQLALTLHPDKAGPGSEDTYTRAVRASEALSDDESRKEYDELLRNGVPWQENYYGKYAHKYGAPNVDVRYIIAGLIAFISVSQYYSQYEKHHKYMRLAKQTVRYQNKVKQMQNQKTQKSRFEDDDEDEDGELKIHITGAEKPRWRDVLAVKLALLPYTIIYGLYILSHKIYRGELVKKMTKEEMETEHRLKMGMDEEEWEKHKRQQAEKEEKFKSSAKYKRFKRFLKNR